GLLMSRNETLSLRDVLELRLPPLRLAVLSACETGLPGTALPDESISLPSGFLQAGAAAVIASLWCVPDLGTAMLMARFYDLWRNGNQDPAEALCGAQQWLRDTTNEEKKSYFGGFATGSSRSPIPPQAAAE